jgi:hypothetical protein
MGFPCPYSPPDAILQRIGGDRVDHCHEQAGGTIVPVIIRELSDHRFAAGARTVVAEHHDEVVGLEVSIIFQIDQKLDFRVLC